MNDFATLSQIFLQCNIINQKMALQTPMSPTHSDITWCNLPYKSQKTGSEH